MMARGWCFVFAMLTAIQLTACTQRSAESSSEPISATAVAESSCCSGEVTTRSATPTEDATWRQEKAGWEQIDAKYPPAKPPPADAPLQRVVAVDQHGRIVVENGTALLLRGLDCSEEGYGYMSRLLTDKESDERVVVSAPTSAGPSQIWITQVAPPGRYRGYQLLTELALQSGWCAPNSAASDRDRALAAYGAKVMQAMKAH